MNLTLIKDLVLPNIPEDRVAGITYFEEFILDFEDTYNLTRHKDFKNLLWNMVDYRVVWMHEALPALLSFTDFTMYKTPQYEMRFKIRLLHYDDMKLAIIRRKWPKADFIIR